MTITIQYRQDEKTAAPQLKSQQEIWAVAAQMRRQLPHAQIPGAPADRNCAHALMANVRELDVNGRHISVVWASEHDVHDEDGKQVFGVCETDQDGPGTAYVSINGPLLAPRPELMASTVAHELGHVIFDVPAGRRFYRSVTSSAASLRYSERRAEWRANEFMAALLVPAVQLHRQLLICAGREGLKLVRAPNHGRPGCPIVDGNNDPDALCGVVAALGVHFGVSDSFIDTRLRCYGLIGDKTGTRS